MGSMCILMYTKKMMMAIMRGRFSSPFSVFVHIHFPPTLCTCWDFDAAKPRYITQAIAVPSGVRVWHSGQDAELFSFTNIETALFVFSKLTFSDSLWCLNFPLMEQNKLKRVISFEAISFEIPQPTVAQDSNIIEFGECQVWRDK